MALHVLWESPSKSPFHMRHLQHWFVPYVPTLWSYWGTQASTLNGKVLVAFSLCCSQKTLSCTVLAWQLIHWSSCIYCCYLRSSVSTWFISRCGAWNDSAILWNGSFAAIPAGSISHDQCQHMLFSLDGLQTHVYMFTSFESPFPFPWGHPSHWIRLFAPERWAGHHFEFPSWRTERPLSWKADIW